MPSKKSRRLKPDHDFQPGVTWYEPAAKTFKYRIGYVPHGKDVKQGIEVVFPDGCTAHKYGVPDDIAFVEARAMAHHHIMLGPHETS